ncbi:MAG: molecular chaperone DnaJ [Thermosynechococcaceae cyanobacterium]
MTGNLVRTPSPEEQELQNKQAELADLEANLAERELELATIQAELNAFENLYLQMVGIRLQELQRIKTQIEEYTAYLASAHDFRPSGELKHLYRQLAKVIHPDFATDPEERQKREQIMAEANRAYECGDIERLKTLLQDWSSCPESVQGEDLSALLTRTVLKVAQSRQRLAYIEQQMQNLEKTNTFRLHMRAKQAQQKGRDLLAEQARELDQQIRIAQQRLNELKTQTG